MVMKWMPGTPSSSSVRQSSVATSTPNARTAALSSGRSPSSSANRAARSAGNACPDSCTIRVICRALVTGMTPAMIGTSQPRSATRSRRRR